MGKKAHLLFRKENMGYYFIDSLPKRSLYLGYYFLVVQLEMKEGPKPHAKCRLLHSKYSFQRRQTY